MIPLKIIREPNDILTNRISAGGDLQNGLYFVFRGQPKDVREILKLMCDSIEHCKNEIDKMPSKSSYIYPSILGN